ncbi:unannotated protein [freshwater metagenome]|uniref:Unannotated protein n=1 Tax=freshwater metagenome TaxID=449393 RepID=A0A6J7NAZ3_9ZZZZ
MKNTNPAQTMPKIYAHRGASYDFPEHTRAAYVAAIEQGADGFECDLRLTKDSVPILWHDATMERMAGTSGHIAALTYFEIKERYPQVMHFRDFLTFAIENKKDLALETKHPVPTGREIENILAKELDDHQTEILKSGIEISVMSFSWMAIESVRRSMPDINTVILLESVRAKRRRRYSSAQTIGPDIEMIKSHPEFIDKAKADGKRLFVWTVDEAQDVQFCAQAGIDVVITNKPSQARKVLGYP